MIAYDLAVASEDALPGEPEVRRVSAPPSLMLPWTVPMRHARWLSKQTARASESISTKSSSSGFARQFTGVIATPAS